MHDIVRLTFCGIDGVKWYIIVVFHNSFLPLFNKFREEMSQPAKVLSQGADLFSWELEEGELSIDYVDQLADVFALHLECLRCTASSAVNHASYT